VSLLTAEAGRGNRLLRYGHSVTVELSWQLGVVLVLLVGMAVAASTIGRLGLHRSMIGAALRAIVQLSAVSLIIVAAISHLLLSFAFVAVMFAVGVFTTSRRTGLGRHWPWAAATMAVGAVPVLAVIFSVGVVPLEGISIIPVAGIIVGNSMTAHTLVGRRQFAELRSNIPTYEAALSLGLDRPAAIDLVAAPSAPEAMYPNLDQTRTVGVVTLPGAFIGVLLGGGSPVQAGSAQILVLLGVMAAQALVVTAGHRLMMAGKLLPPDLAARLRP